MCKTNPNGLHRIPKYLKKKLKTSAIENGFFSNVVFIQRNVMEEEGQKSLNKNPTYSFGGKVTRSQHWFDIDLDWT